MKILYLLPPSEGKNTGGNVGKERLSFSFEKPIEIAINATEKDLKCKGARYEEGIKLNRHLSLTLSGKEREQVAASFSLEEKEFKIEVFRGDLEGQTFLPAISRYSGVMYNAINYRDMSADGKLYFDDNFLILSGMYGMLKSQDTIGNYKLPIETKGLYAFWGEQITDALNTLEADYIVDFLPNSYKKMIQWDNLKASVIKVDFYKKTPPVASDIPLDEGELTKSLPHRGRGLSESEVGGSYKKLTHGVKKVKGEYIHDICNKNIEELNDFPGEKVQISENEYHISVIQN